MTEHLTDENFDSKISDAKPTVVDFYADWCGPCKQLSPVMEQLSAEFGDQAQVAKLDIDANPEAANRYDVRSIPTLLFFKNGELVDRMLGARPKDVVAAKLRSLVG